MPEKAIFCLEQEKVYASAVVQGRQVRAGSKGKRAGDRPEIQITRF